MNQLRRSREPGQPETVRQAILGGLGLVVLSFAAFSPALSAGYLLSDDKFVYQNPYLPTSEGLQRIWSEVHDLPGRTPLVHSLYWLEYRLWGIQPVGYHAVSLMLHAVAVLCFWRVLRTLRLPAAWLAAACFAVHPIQVDSVAWVAQRGAVLSGLFFMASLWAYLQCVLPQRPRQSRDVRWALYGVAWGLFVLALLSSTVTASLPAVLLLVLWWKRDRLGAADIVPLLPMFLIGAVAGGLTVIFAVDEVPGADWRLSLLERCLIAGRGLLFDAYSLFWPFNLAFDYGRWEIDGTAVWQYMFPVAAAALILVMFRARKTVGRAPLAAVLAFCVMLLPSLTMLTDHQLRYGFVADHFQYHACAALIALFSVLVAGICEDLWRRPRIPFAVLSGLILAVLGAVTFQHAKAYADAETLYLASIRRSPLAAQARNSLGYLLFKRGEFIQARMLFEQCLTLDPADRARYLSNIGLCHGQQESWQLAIKNYEQSLELEPEASNVMANYSMSLVRDTGRREEAIKWATKAVELDPDNADYRYTLAVVLGINSRHKDAIRQMREAVDIAPGDPRVRFELGKFYAADKNLPEAIRNCELALQVRETPDWVVTIGAYYFENGEIDRAIDATKYGLHLARQAQQLKTEQQAKLRLAIYLEQRAKTAAQAGQS